MKLAHWVFLLTTLGVGGAGLYLYLSFPFLEVPTPFGPWPLHYLLPGAYALGLVVGGLYALALGWGAFAERRALLKEVRRLQGELEALRRERIEEVPRIPDREEA
ncbi:hypothetical protein [Thermus thermamylovorans]|uniref:DUF1049 domain-containing protein n=1 Tax=Thermus thermamylovorans TaxID=2509362 RepID=A0A4Q9B6L1_9DEIN|nr:hypothetical protein [Thermus thermamylovorans]TBH21765.1 hypothetical protein ETP66_00550 [Thermus thermamylovorans]